MYKKICLLLMVVMLAVPVMVMADDQKVYKLKMADSFPLDHPAHKLALGFIDQVQQRSQGRIEIEYYPAEQLGKMKDLLRLCQGGLTDITYLAPSYYAGQIPLNTVMVLPFWTTAAEGTMIYKALIKDSPELVNELARYNVRCLGAFTTSQYDIGSVRTPIASPDSLKGLRLGSPGGIFERIAARYGITPVAIASPEIYEATQRGVIEGNILTLPSVAGYRLHELQRHHTLGMRMGGYPSMYVINNNSFEKLPRDLQMVLLGVADGLATTFAKQWDGLNEQVAAKFEAAGITIRRIAPDERETWDAPIEGIENEWIRDMERRGLPGQKVFDQFKAAVEQVMAGQ